MARKVTSNGSAPSERWASGAGPWEDVEGREPTGSDAAGVRRDGRTDLVVLTCIEIDVETLSKLGVRPGGAHVIANAGGALSEAAKHDLVLAKRILGAARVLVVWHAPCALDGVGERHRDRARGPEDVPGLRAALAGLVAPPLSFGRDAVEGRIWGIRGEILSVRLA